MVVDAIVLVILLISAFVAFWRGFIREFVTICGAAGGLTAAFYTSPTLKPFMRSVLGVVEGKAEEKLFGILPYGLVADALSYLIVFIVVFAILSFLSHVLSEKARSVGLGPVDRTLGVMFGLVRGLIILGLLYLPLYFQGDKEMKKKWFADSKTHIYVEATSGWIAALLPKEMQDKPLSQPELTTRDALEAINVLKGDKNTDNTIMPETQSKITPDTPQKGEKGYDDKARETIDHLMDIQTQDQPVQTGTP